MGGLCIRMQARDGLVDRPTWGERSFPDSMSYDPTSLPQAFFLTPLHDYRFAFRKNCHSRKCVDAIPKIAGEHESALGF
jgi:hypothetical protein